MTFGTNAFTGMSLTKIAAKYDQVRAFVMALPNCKFANAADFDAFIDCFSNGETGMRAAKSRLLSAFGQVTVHMTHSTFVPPSPETLAWGCFLGGEWQHNSRDAEAACLSLLAA